MALTQEYLHEHFTYKNGRLFHKTTIKGKCKAGNILGGFDPQGYCHCTILKQRYKNSKLIFLFHKGYVPNLLDHKDRNPSNDNIENLREATPSNNSQNTTARKNCTSKYKGVNFCKRSTKWRTRISVNKKVIELGYFSDEIEAAKAYDNAANIHYGEFANFNLIGKI